MTRLEALGYALGTVWHEQELMEEALGCEYEMGEVVQEQQWMVDELRETAAWKESEDAIATLREMFNEEHAKNG